MTQHDDRLYLRHMLESAQKAQTFIHGKGRDDYDQDEPLRIALTHLVQTVGEAARHVSEMARASYPTIPWKAIMGMRHRIVHNYAEVDEDVIWKTVIEDLPPLILILEVAFESDEDTE